MGDFKYKDNTLYVDNLDVGGMRLGVNASSDIVALNNPAETKMLLSNMKRMSRSNSQSGIYTPFTILHASDIHGDSNALTRLIEYKKEYKRYIDAAIISGDIVRNSFSDDFSYYSGNSDAHDIMLAIGNHDTAKFDSENITFDWTHYVGLESYNRYLKDFVNIWGVVYESGKCYYYKDYTSYKIRLIVLDCMETTANGTASPQIAWLEQTLNGAKDIGYSVICVYHYYSRTTDWFDCPFTTRQFLTSPSISPNYIDKVEEFIASGGDFVCWLTGHTHMDFAGVIKNTHQTVITVDCAADTQGAIAWSDTERIKGTVSEDLFNIVGVDTYQKIIKVLRVGANRDSWMRKKHTMCIQYASNNLYELDGGKPQLLYCE